jgi:hypothetical protein
MNVPVPLIVRWYDPFSYRRLSQQLHHRRTVRYAVPLPWPYVVRSTSTLIFQAHDHSRSQQQQYHHRLRHLFHTPSNQNFIRYSGCLLQQPLPVIIFSVSPQHLPIGQQQQIRLYMSYRKKLKLKGGKNIVKHLPKNMCKIEFCHSKYDLKDYHERNRGYEDSDEDRDDSDHQGIFTVRFDVNAIIRIANDYYMGKDVRNELEYYTHTTKQWKKFPTTAMKDDPDIHYYQGKGSRPIPLRIRSSYQIYNDGLSDDDKSNEKVIASREEKPMVIDMLYIINQLSQRLVRLEYKRIKGKKYNIASQFINMNQPTSIQEWLLQQMKIDRDLYHIILRHPNSIQHISTCLAEFDHLWIDEEDPFLPYDDEEMKNKNVKKRK